jgi:nucleoside-diphosphate-sugar epimerase
VSAGGAAAGAGQGQRGRVLVTGAAGVMGARLVRGLLDAGWTVRALVLPGDPLRARLDGLACEIHFGDVTDPDSLRGACDGVDTVYHLAAVILARDPAIFPRVNRDGTAHMVAEAARAGVRHFIYVSSASVTYPKRTIYGQSKLDAEALVAGEPAFAHTIVRPTLVYDQVGGQAGGEEFVRFLAYLRRWPVVPFIGAGRARKRPVWSGDVVDGLLRLAGNPVSHGKTYNFSGGESISIADFARLMLRHHGGARPLLPVPVSVCRALAWALGAALRSPPLTASTIASIVNEADLDPGPAMRELGYRPLGVHEGFARCFPHPSRADGSVSSPVTFVPSSGDSP